MTRYLYPTATSLLFALIYRESAVARVPSVAAAVMVFTFVVWLISYLLPPTLFRYTDEQAAPVVLSQLMRRAAVAVVCVLVCGLAVLYLTGLWDDLPLIEELYAFTLIGVVLFHGFGGPFAYHIVYLQQTQQYNSNQLAAVLIAFTLMGFILALFFLNLDFGTARDAHIQRRDLLLLTTVLLGYGWTLYKVAHH
ncbi:MAG: hypothetical protein HYR71_12085 [Chloroflexi bacterium]|nr:hypothetical protein [Chloroflexota bacterium]